MRRVRDEPGFVKFPVPVLVDSREQLPWSFAGFRADAKDRRRPLVVELMRWTLNAGDYSLWGMHDRVTIERKSVADLFGTIGQGRDRFERELERMQTYEFAAVVCEADWSAILGDPPPFTELSPKIVFRSVIAWQQRFPRVHWWMLPDRKIAETAALRILERFWKDDQAKAVEAVPAG